MVPPGIPVVELFSTQRTGIFGFSSVDFHVILHLLFSGKSSTAGWAFVWFFLQVDRLDVLIQNCHFVVGVPTEGANVVF